MEVKSEKLLLQINKVFYEDGSIKIVLGTYDDKISLDFLIAFLCHEYKQKEGLDIDVVINNVSKMFKFIDNLVE